MLRFLRPLLASSLLLASTSLSIGCASEAAPEDDATAAAELATGLHEPQGDERKAIHAAIRASITSSLHGQAVIFNSTDPRGRFQAHGGWAYYEGILEGPNGNAQPIDYKNSEYAWEFENGYLEGVIRNGKFAAKIVALVQRQADGTWQVASESYGNGETWPAFAIGTADQRWIPWVELAPRESYDVFPFAPSDTLHEPQGEERKAILGGIRERLGADLNGQTFGLNSTQPDGHFQTHDGWAFYQGIIEGPNGNVTPINYQNSAFSGRKADEFRGVLRNGNFAANITAILQKGADGSWRIAEGGAAYWVGGDDHVWSSSNGVFESLSPFSYDIFPYSGEGH